MTLSKIKKKIVTNKWEKKQLKNNKKDKIQSHPKYKKHHHRQGYIPVLRRFSCMPGLHPSTAEKADRQTNKSSGLKNYPSPISRSTHHARLMTTHPGKREPYFQCGLHSTTHHINSLSASPSPSQTHTHAQTHIPISLTHTGTNSHTHIVTII